jgi:membrane protease subunit (stomatin/prohibitin family)
VGLFSREFIAVPDDKKRQIVFKWPDVNLRRFSKVIIEPDQIAVFLNRGQVIGTLPPGRHDVDANELPFLGAFIDRLTGGNAYRAELYFVGTREYTGNTFGGRIDEVQDPQTGMLVTLRVFGDYSMRVVDPVALITNLVGTVDVSDNEAITLWMANQLLKVMRTDITRQIVRNGWPVLGLSAYTPDIERAVVEAGNKQLATYGVSIIRMGNFDVNLEEEDMAALERFSKDTAYSRLAGSFGQYAQGEALLGAGEGMAKGGAATGGAFLATGLGFGQQMTQPQPPGPPPPPAPGFPGGGQGYSGGGGGGGGAAAVACPSCAASNQPGAKFCASCGTALASPDASTPACPSCGSANQATARFCSSCGATMAPAVRRCANCGEELAAGAKFCATCGTPALPEPAAPAADAAPAAEG